MTEADIHARFVRYYETVAELHRYSLMPLGDFAQRRSPCSHRSFRSLFATVLKVWGIKRVENKKAEVVENQRPPLYCVQDEDTIMLFNG